MSSSDTVPGSSSSAPAPLKLADDALLPNTSTVASSLGTNTPRNKSARAKKVGAEDDGLLPGRRHITKSFLKLSYGEGDVAGYLGYEDISQLRRLAMSGYALKYYVFAYKDRHKAQVHKSKILEYIRDQPLAMESEENPIDAYPSQDNDRHHISRTALSVCQMRRAIEKCISGTRITQSEHESAQSEFANVIGRTPPSVEIDKVEVRSLGPFAEIGESDLEAHNRCLNLLSYIQVSSNKASWAGRFGSGKWDVQQRISAENQPRWMRTDQKQAELAPDEELPEHSAHVRAREFKVVWKYNSREEGNLELVTHLEAEGLENGLVINTAITLRSTMTREEVRDYIRLKFKMDTIGAQISNLDIRPSRLNIMEDDWDSIHDVLWGADSSEIDFSMTLRKREDDELLLEHADASGLAKLVVTTKDGDVAPVKAAPSTTPPEDETVEEAAKSVDTSHMIVELVSRMTGNHNQFLDPNKLFRPKKTDKSEAMKKFWTIGSTAHNVTTPAGLLSWQTKAHEILTRRDTVKTKQDGITSRFGKQKLTPEQQEAWSAAEKEGMLTIMGIADATSLEDSEHHYYALNALHTGTQGQVGLPLLPSARALELQEYTDPSDNKQKYRSLLPDLQKMDFYPWQVTGITTCLVSMTGSVPMPPTATKDARDAAKELEGLGIGGKFIVDSTGMGKTKLLVSIIWFARFHHTLNDQGNRIYEVSVILVPAGVLVQWVEEITSNYPSLHLIISYDATDLSEGFQDKCIDAKTMKSYGDAENWPERFRYIFDETDPKTGMTVILTSQDAAVSRTLIEHINVKAGKRYDPPRYDKTGVEKWKVEPEEIKTYTSIVEGKVGITAVDEAQRLKNHHSRRWLACTAQHARHAFVLGATPMSNTGVVSKR